MSFKAVITDPGKQNIWFRAIYVLSTIQDDIKITVTTNELIAWSMNETDTSLCQIRFEKSFFEEYDFKPHEIVFGENGIQVIDDTFGNNHKLYSFRVNGRHLTTISRKPDGDIVKSFTIAVNNTSTCPESLANRLIVVIEMDSLIVKEYCPQFQPIKYDPIIINLKYKRKFLDVFGTAASDRNPQEPLDPKLLDVFTNTERELTSALFNEDVESDIRKRNHLTAVDEINYICCNSTLLKNFLDNCNVNVTDEVKLEINVHKLSITAFTKAVYGKNNDLLRNALSMSNTISTLDLEHYCLFTTIEDEQQDKRSHTKRKEHMKSIVFKLKDFKNFITISPSWKSQGGNDNISLWFCHPGDPILMQMQKPGIKLELVEVTDSNITDDAIGGNFMKTAVSASKEEGKKNNKKSYGSPLRSKTTSKGGNQSLSATSARKSPLKASSLVPDSDSAVTNGHGINTARKLFVEEQSQTSNYGRENLPAQTISINTNMNQKSSLYGTEAHKSDCSNNQTNTLKRSVKDICDEAEDISQQPTVAKRADTTVTWGRMLPISDDDTSSNDVDRKEMLKKEKLKHLKNSMYVRNGTNDCENQENKEEGGLGLTQVERPRGLFD
ncbi:ddc1p [Saccharomyces arboricola H-6]|uniref:DNA damage checkpoint protein 1 n=1 Tax=Saccharomyces arboricola (strain H-6 / AS 2.3317 / CBS 10644) TaxID=1160507 RepID=J8PVR5_SACAR|nr:ddc1p [Saccharomyces arboricola H-6]